MAAWRERAVDKFLTWRTGYSKQEREWLKWEEQNVVRYADTIENMFMNFKYILPVTTDIFNQAEPFGWVPNKDFKEYVYPQRALGDNAVYYFARGLRNQWDGRFHISDMFGYDQVFVATNNSKDAMMIALKYS